MRALTAALAVTVFAAVLGAVLTYGRTGRVQDGIAKLPGALLLQDGSAFERIAVPPSAPAAELVFNDGSRVTVDAGTTLEPLAISPSEFILRLAAGKAAFHVQPGGPRRWSIEAGLASITVMGTQFSVERGPAEVHVAVRTGTVLVRGERVRDGVVRLGTGQSLRVRGNPEPSGSGREPRAPSPADQSRAPRELAPRSSAFHPAPPVGDRWQDTVARGDYDVAYEALGAAGIARESDRSRTPDELLALADVARLSGHPADAIAPLERLLELHGTSPRAAVGAVTLGRIELDLGRPARAASALQRAVTLGVPDGLKEDVYVRLVEAYAKSNQRMQAQKTGEMYRQSFPAGRRRNEVEQWLAR